MTVPHGALKQAVINALRDLMRDLGHSPSVREISGHIGTRGVGHVHRALDELKEAGVVTWEKGRSRTLRIVQEGPTREAMERWSDEELERVRGSAYQILADRARREAVSA